MQNLNINITQKMTQEQQVIFPNITFTCNGSITKLTAGIDVPEDTGLSHMTSEDKTSLAFPEIQIWRRRNEIWSNSYIKIESIPLNTTQVNQNIAEITPLYSIRVQEGDILGVYQPSHSNAGLSIKYQEHDGPINYIENNPHSSFDLLGHTTIQRYNYPLVTMEITQGMFIAFMNYR